ncbi:MULTISPECIES: response regulator [Salegentibacter]|uniref:Response regulator n=1 Tax=Salegentibacter maritimus TaxID=2794347 RepID=A0ABS0THR7_9FLAO|nr:MULTISPECIES: response regulator [Salegentibacter]MBE7639201.1 response regulator [Salegentibacter sp. BLCTC]MBI6117322.1 response regulator [Salegentibacter maritimus]MBI6119786.1 response regulator [Salegentibacter maritimus]
MLEVIIVDDDQIVIFIQEKMIINHDIASNPISFRKATVALNYLDEQQQRNENKNFLIFLDINMPNINGWDFLKHLESHKENSNYHVVMVTSSINDKDRKEVEKYSMVRSFIEKPIASLDCEKIKEIPEISHFFERV